MLACQSGRTYRYCSFDKLDYEILSSRRRLRKLLSRELLRESLASERVFFIRIYEILIIEGNNKR